MQNVGFIGWRGMVGSVLMDRMVQENDFSNINPVFFTTSQAGQKAPVFGGKDAGMLKNAFDIEELKKLDIIVTCQGGDYTNEVYPKLKASGWDGYWVDAASALRMKDDAIIVLDPVNQHVISDGLKKGVKTFVGGNCTVSLMLMADCLRKIWWNGFLLLLTRLLLVPARKICANCWCKWDNWKTPLKLSWLIRLHLF